MIKLDQDSAASGGTILRSFSSEPRMALGGDLPAVRVRPVAMAIAQPGLGVDRPSYAQRPVRPALDSTQPRLHESRSAAQSPVRPVAEAAQLGRERFGRRTNLKVEQLAQLAIDYSSQVGKRSMPRELKELGFIGRGEIVKLAGRVVTFRNDELATLQRDISSERAFNRYMGSLILASTLGLASAYAYMGIDASIGFSAILAGVVLSSPLFWTAVGVGVIALSYKAVSVGVKSAMRHFRGARVLGNLKERVTDKVIPQVKPQPASVLPDMRIAPVALAAMGDRETSPLVKLDQILDRARETDSTIDLVPEKGYDNAFSDFLHNVSGGVSLSKRKMEAIANYMGIFSRDPLTGELLVQSSSLFYKIAALARAAQNPSLHGEADRMYVSLREHLRQEFQISASQLV